MRFRRLSGLGHTCFVTLSYSASQASTARQQARLPQWVIIDTAHLEHTESALTPIADKGADMTSVAKGHEWKFSFFGPNKTMLYYSGNPALRRPSAQLAKCSGRRIGNQFLRLDMHSAGSIRRKRAMACRASSKRPASAWLAEATAAAGREFGSSRNAFSAHDDASS